MKKIKERVKQVKLKRKICISHNKQQKEKKKNEK